MKEIIFKKHDSIKVIAETASYIDSLDDSKDYVLEIKEKKKKRSLNANAYCWKLCTEIANVLRSDKDSIYFKMLKRYGQSELVSVRADIDVSGYFKYYEYFGTGYAKGKEFTHYTVFKGSSEYDTREMSILLDGIVDEAKNLDIPTLDDLEFERLCKEWGED